MGYDDLKKYKGRAYTGMAVGRTHVWDYPDGVWKERKITPDLWHFSFASSKSRKGRGAPEGSGVPVGTGYHWFLQSHQFVRKLDANTYETFMEGLKHKIAHKRPDWEEWSTERSGPSDKAKLVAVLEETLAAVKTGSLEEVERTAPKRTKRASKPRRGLPPAEAAPAEA